MPVKLEWLGYRMVEKLWRYIKPFSYNTSVSRTDRQTDRRTDRITISISRVSSSMLTRNKKWIMPLPTEVHWWLKKGWGSVNVFSTVWKQERHPAIKNSAPITPQLLLMAPITLKMCPLWLLWHIFCVCQLPNFIAIAVDSHLWKWCPINCKFGPKNNFNACNSVNCNTKW